MKSRMLAYKWECLGHRAATKRLGCERRGSTSLQANRHPYDGILLAFPSSGKLGNDPTFQGIRCGWNRLASPLASALGGIVGTFDRARGLLRSQGFAMPIDDDTITRIKRRLRRNARPWPAAYAGPARIEEGQFVSLVELLEGVKEVQRARVLVEIRSFGANVSRRLEPGAGVSDDGDTG
jgi:hypothetical protein